MGRRSGTWGGPGPATPARPMPAGNCPPTPWGPIPPPLTGTGAPAEPPAAVTFDSSPFSPRTQAWPPRLAGTLRGQMAGTPTPPLPPTPGSDPVPALGRPKSPQLPPLGLLRPVALGGRLSSGLGLPAQEPCYTPSAPFPPTGLGYPRTRSCCPPPISNRLQTASGHPRRCVLSWLLGVVQLLSSPASVEIAGEFSLPPPSSFKKKQKMAEFLDEQNTRLCDNCKREIPEFNFTMHEIHCQRNISLCRLCKEPLPKAEMEVHLATEHCQVTCKCNKKLEKRQLQRHEEAECPLRLALCQHCDLELSVAKLKEHEDYCGARTELCGSCGHNVLVKDLKTHPGVCGKDQERRRAGTAASPNARDQSCSQDRILIASQLLRHIEALAPPVRLTRIPLRDFESDLFHSHSQSPEQRTVETQFPIHNNLLEERERQERNRSRQPSRAVSDDSANLDYMLALSLQNEGQAPSVAQLDLQKDMCEANPGRDGLSVPDDSLGAGETLLPCEFCEELYPEELLIDHQTSCNPSCAFPPIRPHIPSPKSAEDPDVIFRKLLQEEARNQLDSLMGLDSSDPAEESVIIPCEFCGVQLEEEVLFHHQDQCDQRPVTANHPVMEGIPRQDSRPQVTSPELPKRRIRHQGDLSFGYMDNIKQIKGPAYPLPTLNNGVPPYNQLSAPTPGSRPTGHPSPPQVLKLNNLDSQELRGRNRIGHSGVPATEHSLAVRSVRNLYPENLAPPFPRGPVGRYGASGRNIPVTTTSASHRSRAAKAKAPKQPGAGGAVEEEEE